MDSSAAEDIRENLALQVSEVEMLSSMFVDQSEFVLDDQSSIAEINAFLNGHIAADCLQGQIGFTINLSIAGQPLQLVCRFPHMYPSIPPKVFTRVDSLSRTQHQKLSEALQCFLSAQQPGELLTYSLIQWLRDNAHSYLFLLSDTASAESKTQSQAVTSGGPVAAGSGPRKKTNPLREARANLFSRMWIYSHHIRNPVKRKGMLDLADELNLTGFYVPGQPGIVCIEGYNKDVEEFWGQVRRWTWKRIQLKEKEDWDIGDKSVDDMRKFGTFEERYLTMRQTHGRRAHPDRGELFQFLEERGLGHIFSLYFHVDGKHAE